MEKLEKNRIDKWLWAVRIYKTRQLASKGCNSGKVKINDKRIKPSRSIKIHDIITVQKGFIKYSYKVVDFLDKRISAKLITNYIEDITSEEEIVKLKISNTYRVKSRKKGLGRPTKRERRKLDKQKWDNLEE